MGKRLRRIVLGLGILGSFGLGAVSGWYGKQFYDYQELINSIELKQDSSQQFMYASYNPSSKRKLDEGLTLFSDDPEGDLTRILKNDIINSRGDDGHRYKVQIDLNRNKVNIKP